MSFWIMGIPHFIEVHFIALCRYCGVFFVFCFCFFYKLKVYGNPALRKSVGIIFFNSICSLHVLVPHFGNSHNILNFFIIILFIMVVCDQWSLSCFCCCCCCCFCFLALLHRLWDLSSLTRDWTWALGSESADS